MDYHSTENMEDQPRNVAEPSLFYGSSPQVNKRSWSDVNDSTIAFEDQRNDCLYPQDPQQKRPRVVTTQYLSARDALFDDSQPPNEQQYNKEDTGSNVPETIGFLDGSRDFNSTLRNHQMYQNTHDNTSSPMDLDYEPMLEYGVISSHSYDVQLDACHTTPSFGATTLSQTYSALKHPYSNGTSDTQAPTNPASPTLSDFNGSGGAGETWPHPEEHSHVECDTCF